MESRSEQMICRRALQLVAAFGLVVMGISLHAQRRYVVEGCLMTYSASLSTMFGRLAYFVDLILKGAKPAELAIEQPREFEFAINQKTAQSLGLTLPSSLLLQATEVIR